MGSLRSLMAEQPEKKEKSKIKHRRSKMTNAVKLQKQLDLLTDTAFMLQEKLGPEMARLVWHDVIQLLQGDMDIQVDDE